MGYTNVLVSCMNRWSKMYKNLSLATDPACLPATLRKIVQIKCAAKFVSKCTCMLIEPFTVHVSGFHLPIQCHV